MDIRRPVTLIALAAMSIGPLDAAGTSGSLSIAPQSIAFGSQRTGWTSAPVTVSLTNNGGQTVVVAGVSSNSGQFLVTSACASIAVGASCTFTVVFAPTSVGDLSATITIASDGAGSPQTVAVSGTGTASVIGPPPPTPPVNPPAPTTIDLVEYYHAAWDAYFITGTADEIAKLDQGVFPGWTRTGQGFKAYPLDESHGAAACRFFSGESFAPRSTHFFTQYPNECLAVRGDPLWHYEGDVFRINAPEVNGACPSGMLPVYRLYNDGQGGAPSHRYTTDIALRSQMLARGWISEGYGPLGVAMCAPA